MARWLFLLMSLMAPVVSAQTTDFERILLPIVIDGEIPGAFGSRWAARLAIMNTSADGIRIFGYNPYPGGCVILCPPVPTTPPGITFFPSIAPGSMSQGAIIEVERRSATSVRFNLRIQDVSRQSQTWGTEIPVVREAELFTGTIHLLAVPLSSAFRSTLRVYDIDAQRGAQFRLRFYRLNPAVQSPIAIVGPVFTPDTLLAERILTLQQEQRQFGHPELDLGYFELSSLGTIPELAGTGQARIDVQPLTPGLRLWAFVSVTNSETQHVTLITPQ